MDPQVTLNELIREALAMQDPDAVSDLAYALVEWHAKGGFLPDLKTALDLVIQRRKDMQA